MHAYLRQEDLNAEGGFFQVCKCIEGSKAICQRKKSIGTSSATVAVKIKHGRVDVA